MRVKNISSNIFSGNSINIFNNISRFFNYLEKYLKKNLIKTKIIISLLFFMIFFTTFVSAQINSTSPKQFETLTQGKNQIIKINHTYSTASIFWFFNGQIIDAYNNKKEILLNTTKYLLDNSQIDFDDSETDLKITVKVIDTQNPFNSDNYTWEFFVEPLDFTFTTDKSNYFTGQTILLKFNVKKETKLDISILGQNGNLVMKYPTVTVADITEFLIDSPENVGEYKIEVNSQYYEYSKKIQNIITVSENNILTLDNNFIKIWLSPINPSINETVQMKALMNNYDFLEFKWDLNGDSTYDKTGKEIQYSFDKEKEYIIKLNIKNTKTYEEITRYEKIEVGSEAFVLKFVIKDFFTKNPIANSKIIINGQELTTNNLGEATTTIKKGTYNVRIASPEYSEYNQNIDLKSNYVHTVYLYKSEELEKAINSDVKKPDILLISPKNGEISKNLLTTFEFNATDNTFLSSCTLYIKTKNAADWNQKIEKTELGDSTNQKIIVDLGFNTYLFKVICVDKKNNQAYTETREFSISQYATEIMYQDDLKRISEFITTINDAITDPREDDEIANKIYDIYNIDENLVYLNSIARENKDDFNMLIMNKESNSKINEKINEINKFMEDATHNNIRNIRILKKRQFLRSYTEEKIRETIDDMYQGIFDEETLSELVKNMMLKQDNLDIITKMITIKLNYFDGHSDEKTVIINQISQKNLNEKSLIYQLIPSEITGDKASIIINSTYGEITKTLENKIIVTIYPEKTDNEPYYIINEPIDLDKINSFDTILIDNGDKTENIKKIVEKTNSIDTLSEEEKPNILNSIENIEIKENPYDKSQTTGLENIQGKIIDNNDISADSIYKSSFNNFDIIPYIVLTFVLGIMIATGLVLFKNNEPKTNKNNKHNSSDELDLIQKEIEFLQEKISKKITKLEKDEDNFINKATSHNIKEINIINNIVNEIESEKDEKVKEELKQIQTENNHPLTEFYISEDNKDAKNIIDNFNNQIEDLKKELFK